MGPFTPCLTSERGKKIWDSFGEDQWEVLRPHLHSKYVFLQKPSFMSMLSFFVFFLFCLVYMYMEDMYRLAVCICWHRMCSSSLSRLCSIITLSHCRLWEQGNCLYFLYCCLRYVFEVKKAKDVGSSPFYSSSTGLTYPSWLNIWLCHLISQVSCLSIKYISLAHQLDIDDSLPVCLFVCLHVCLCLSLSVCLSVCLSVYLSPS